MESHYWLFPWLALAAGLVAVAIGAFTRGPKSVARSSEDPSEMPAASPWLWTVWVVCVAALTAGELWAGKASGVEFVGARGIVLGALGGIALVAACRRGSQYLSPLSFGLVTALVAAARLWLTHGEITGLIALSLGSALSVAVIGLGPSLTSTGTRTKLRMVSGLAYLITLASTVAIAFTRAAVRADMLWADVPLLLSAAASLGSAVAPWRLLPGPLRVLSPAAIAGGVIMIPVSRVLNSTQLPEAVLLGFAVVALLPWISLGESSPAGFDWRKSAALVLLVAGATLAFAIDAGFGLALFVFGGWLALSGTALPSDWESVPEFLPLQTMVFGALVLAYRLAVLSAGSALKSGPAASWDLFAVCIGAALPQAIAEWLRMRSRNENRTGAAIAEWVGLLVFVPCVLSYVWQPRALGGMLLGAAFGQILAPRPVNGGAFAGMSLSALIFGLMLVQTMPVLPLVGAPHRDVRIVLIAACALAVVVRLLIPVRPAPAAGRALS